MVTVTAPQNIQTQNPIIQTQNPPSRAHHGGMLWNWTNGAGSTVVIAPLAWGIAALTRSLGIASGTVSDVGKELIHGFTTTWEAKVDPMTVVNSACPLEFLAEELNKHPGQPTTVSSLKTSLFTSTCLATPVFEELVFRGFIQGPALTFLFRVLGKKELGEGTSGKVLRTIITAGFFAAYANSIGASYYPDALARLPMVSNFILGIAASTLKEVGHGLSGSIGLRMAHNFFILTPNLLPC